MLAGLIIAFLAIETAASDPARLLADFTLPGETIRRARILSICPHSQATHCDQQFSPGVYRDARCRWTDEPSLAECRFVIDYPNGPGAPNRQLMRRTRTGWVAIWRE